MNDHTHYLIREDEVINPDCAVNPSDYRLLRRLKLPPALNEPTDQPVKRALYLDVESTGLRLGVDEVIELAMLPFDYEPVSGHITTIHHDQAFNALREPELPIPPEATAVNGITESDVAGQDIDEADVNNVVESASLIVAHNAAFDRPMVEAHWPIFKTLPWACSLRDVSWSLEGFSAHSLEVLGMRFGWFFDGHRALADCEAGIALLGETLPVSNVSVMSQLRDNARAKTYRIPATGAKFEKKDVLKERGYRWNPEDKVWWTEVRELDEEIDWLTESVFGHEPNLNVETITAKTRYSG